MPKTGFNFSADNIRVIKIIGGVIDNSFIINGLVFNKCVEGEVKKVSNARVVAFFCSFGGNNLSFLVYFTALSKILIIYII